MNTEVADDADLAWDEFVPDADEDDGDDENEEDVARRSRAQARESGLEVEEEPEDLELAQEDLDLRWDAFEGEDPEADLDDEVAAAAAADDARIAAALERMERRVMGIEDEELDPSAGGVAADDNRDGHLVGTELTGTELTGTELTGTELTGTELTGGPLSYDQTSDDAAGDTLLTAGAIGSVEIAGLGASDGSALSGETPGESEAPGQTELSAEDRSRIDAAFARMEEALFGEDSGADGEDVDEAIFDRLDVDEESDEWLDDEQAPAANVAGTYFAYDEYGAGGEAGYETEARYETEAEYGTETGYETEAEYGTGFEAEAERAGPAGVGSEEPDAWPEDAGAGEYASAGAESHDAAPVHAEFDAEGEWLGDADAAGGPAGDPGIAGREADAETAWGSGAPERDPEPEAAAAFAQFTALDDGSAHETSATGEFAGAGPAGAAVSDERFEATPIVIPSELAEDFDLTGEDGEGDAPGASPARVHGSRRTRTDERRDVRRLALLACLFFAVIIGAAVLHFGHIHSGSSTPPATAAPSAASSAAEITRFESAITDVQSASSGAQAELSTLSSFPTTLKVATIINPYVDSLQLYQTLASTVALPESARSAAATADAQVHQDISYLGGINSLPPIQLGSFIDGFFARSTQLQSTMDALQHALNPATP